MELLQRAPSPVTLLFHLLLLSESAAPLAVTKGKVGPPANPQTFVFALTVCCHLAYCLLSHNNLQMSLVSPGRLEPPQWQEHNGIHFMSLTMLSL